MDFLAEMERWAQTASPSGSVTIGFRRGRDDLPKRSADVGMEASGRIGYAGVWDTGEFEAEVVDVQTEERLFVRSSVLRGTDDLGPALDDVLAATQGERP